MHTLAMCHELGLELELVVPDALRLILVFMHSVCQYMSSLVYPFLSLSLCILTLSIYVYILLYLSILVFMHSGFVHVLAHKRTRTRARTHDDHARVAVWAACCGCSPNSTRK